MAPPEGVALLLEGQNSCPRARSPCWPIGPDSGPPPPQPSPLGQTRARPPSGSTGCELRQLSGCEQDCGAFLALKVTGNVEQSR